MTTTKGLYDDPAFLEKVKAEFNGMYPIAALRINQPGHPAHQVAQALYVGFVRGVEFAVTEGLKDPQDEDKEVKRNAKY